jgi:hypothetical protein
MALKIAGDCQLTFLEDTNSSNVSRGSRRRATRRTRRAPSAAMQGPVLEAVSSVQGRLPLVRLHLHTEQQYQAVRPVRGEVGNHLQLKPSAKPKEGK